METIKKLAAACDVSFLWLADGTAVKQATVMRQEAGSATQAPESPERLVVPKSGRAEKAAVAVLIQEARLAISARSGESSVPIDETAANAVYLEKV